MCVERVKRERESSLLRERVEWTVHKKGKHIAIASSRQVDSRTRNNKTSSLVDHPFFGLPNPEILKTEPTTRERERYHGGSEVFFFVF